MKEVETLKKEIREMYFATYRKKKARTIKDHHKL
jgi:hypothetical protein